MRVDGGFDADIANAAATAKAAEDAGFDGAWTPETSHDPFLACAVAAEHTSRIQIGTGIAVAFARSPMTVAYTANDLQRFSEGRFILGLGSQIKPHIARRFSMPWSKPAARMREFIVAMHEIWRSWNEGERLRFEGDFYQHTLMTPFFVPQPNPHGPPKVFLAAVGERMTQVAGEVADGLLVHAFSTERYIREVTMPALEAGLAAAGRARADVELSIPSFVVPASDERAAAGVRQQIAFYGSTPAYKGVLDIHGWGDLQPELNALSKRGEWVEMGKLIDDEVLDAFAVVAEPSDVAARLRQRFEGLVDRVSFYGLGGLDAKAREVSLATLRG